MYKAANAYARVAQAGRSGREIEADILLDAAAQLQAVHDSWDEKKDRLGNALTYNRRIWTILATSAGAEGSPLPAGIQQGIANLALFTFKRTIDIMLQPAPEKLRALISINREIAAGLRGSAAVSAPRSA